ncbi:MAG: gamma-glutamyltransferase, partial [Paracoccaceae bacterium]|nr:gamma-glutamyltransferase [Paracoccaceae bacterium]
MTVKAKGAIAAGHPETARAAAIILEEGGNAFDAVIGGVMAACIAEPVLASLGGGGFCLASPPDGSAVVYDFFTQTPKRRPDDLDFFPIIADFGTAQQEFHIGMGSIATPGVVAGLFALHRDRGHMPLQRIAEPAIRLARTGVKMNATQAYIFQIVKAIYLSNDTSASFFGSRKNPGQP